MQDQVYISYIKTTPEKLWQAITTPEFTRQYWGGYCNISEWAKGSQWRHEGTDKTVRVVGEVLESDPPKTLVISWASPDDTDDVSRVTFEIEPANDVVRLTVTHGNFQTGSDMANKVSKGWPLVLSSLKSFLETGQAIDIFAVKSPCSTEKIKPLPKLFQD